MFVCYYLGVFDGFWVEGVIVVDWYGRNFWVCGCYLGLEVGSWKIILDVCVC